MKRKQKHPEKQYAGRKPWGSSTGSVWMSGVEMSYFKWYQSLAYSKKMCGDRTKINPDSASICHYEY